MVFKLRLFNKIFFIWKEKKLLKNNKPTAICPVALKNSLRTTG